MKLTDIYVQGFRRGQMDALSRIVDNRLRRMLLRAVKLEWQGIPGEASLRIAVNEEIGKEDRRR